MFSRMFPWKFQQDHSGSKSDLAEIEALQTSSFQLKSDNLPILEESIRKSVRIPFF